MAKGEIVGLVIAEGVVITEGVESTPGGLSGDYAVDFVSPATTFDVNVGADGIDAEKCVVTVYDASGVKTDSVGVQALDENTLRFSNDLGTTASYTAVVVQAN